MAAKTAQVVSIDDAASAAVPRGTGSTRTKTRFVAVYGPPKCRKTTACSTIKGAKWLISDSNAIPALDSLGRLPPDDDIYELTSVDEACDIALKLADAAAAGKLKIPAVVLDSMTQFSDWHQQDIAQATGQQWLGQDAKNNGWQRFNQTFFKLIDALVTLSKYVNVIAICHAKEKFEASKGDFHTLNLPPQCATKLGRSINWMFYVTLRSTLATGSEKASKFIEIVKTADGNRVVEHAIHTQPMGLWPASGDPRLDLMEPGDMNAILRKVKLI